MKIKTKLLGAALAMSSLVALLGALAVNRQHAAATIGATKEAQDVARVVSFLLLSDSHKLSQAALQEIVTRLHRTQGRDVAVVDARQLVLADAIPADVGTVYTSDQNDEVGATIVDRQVRTFVEFSPDYPAGIKQIVVPIEGESGPAIGAVILEYTPIYQELMQLTGRTIRQVALAGLGSVVIAFWIAFYMGRSVSRPLQQLTAAATGFASGRADLPMPPPRQDEIGELAAAFDNMIQKRRRAEQELGALRDALEDRVVERTAELATTNEALLAEITERTRAERQLNLQYEVGRALTEAATSQEASARVLQILCENLDWEMAEFYTVDRRAGVLRLDDMWSAPDLQAEAFTALTRQITFALGAGLPGRVWASGNPVWIPDVAVDENFPRAAAAQQAGLHGGFSFPIFAGNEVSHVIEFFSHEVRLPDEEQLRMLAVLGAQLGQFFDRKQAEITTLRLAAIIESSDEVIISKDLSGIITSWNRGAEKVFGYTAGEMLETPLMRLIPADREEEEHQLLWKIKRGETVEHFETLRRTKDGRLIDVSVTASPIKDATGKVIGVSTVARDVTARMQAEQALRESHEKFHQLADHITDAFWIRSPDMRELLYVSPSFERIWGRSAESLYANAHHWVDFILPEDREAVQAAYVALMGDAPSLSVEYRITRPDGAIRWVHTRGFQVRNAAGALIRLTGISSDITERKQTERALRESEERFQLVARATDDAIWDWNIVANTITFSESLGTLFGYRAGEFASTMEFWIGGIHPEDHDALMASVQAFFASPGESWSGEYRFRCANGSYASVYDRGYLVRDGAGQPLRMVGSMMNITERKRAEEELQLSQSRLAEAQHVAQVGSWEWNVEADALTWSDEKWRLFGFAPNAFALSREFQLHCVHPEDRAAAQAWIGAALATGKPPQADFRIVRPDAEVRIMQTRAHGVFDGNGKVIRLLGSSQDVTEQRRAESELRAAKLEAEAANRAKSEFLANMSHEIRTPMNGILGMTELVLETRLDRVQREYLDMAKSSALSLLGLINDILDFSKIEAGKLELEAIGFSLRDCLGTMLKPLGLRADQKGLELMADLPAEVPDHLIGDPLRLRQILINLTDNAIKFTARGEVTLRVEVESALGDEHCLHFTVRDTGIGIPAAKQALIFEAFAQADGTTTRTYGGTGLGLAIVSRLVRQMGGRVWVESTEGVGTTVHFTALLSVRHTPAPNLRHADPSALKGLRVLVVDDHAVNRRILREMLACWGMDPAVVAGGAEAIVELRRAAHAGTPFPLVILDGMMPEMDGFMVAAQIREQAELCSSTVMMLSSAMPAGAAARCGELGVASYLTKPVTKADLLDAVLQAIGGTVNPPPAPEAPPPARVAVGLRILLAEDNVINRALATGILEKRGHALVHAANGREAVEAAGREAFDLILMDVQMPEMDGLEATRQIRASERVTARHTPIAAMTAHAMAGDRERCLAAGMDEYLSKPLQKPALLELLERVAAGWTPAEVPPTLARASLVRPLPIYSREKLLDQLDGDESLLQRMIALFEQNTPGMLDDIRDSVQRRGAGDLARSAHAFMSSLGAFGANDARRLTQQLEAQALAANFEQTDGTFAALERETAAIQAALTVFTEPPRGPAEEAGTPGIPFR